MEKVKITKEQADAYENAKNLPLNKNIQRFMISHAEAVTGEAEWVDEFKPLNTIDLFKMADIIRYGYEVEETKQDKVRKVILEYCNGIAVSEWVVEAIHNIYEGKDA